MPGHDHPARDPRRPRASARPRRQTLDITPYFAPHNRVAHQAIRLSRNAGSGPLSVRSGLGLKERWDERSAGSRNSSVGEAGRAASLG